MSQSVENYQASIEGDKPYESTIFERNDTVREVLAEAERELAVLRYTKLRYDLMKSHMIAICMYAMSFRNYSVLESQTYQAKGCEFGSN